MSRVEHFANDVNTHRVIMDNLAIHIQVLIMEQEVIIHQVVSMVHILIIPTVQVQCTVQIIMVLVAWDNMVLAVWVNMVLAVWVNMVLAVWVNMVLAAWVNMDNIRTIRTVVSDLVALAWFFI